MTKEQMERLAQKQLDSYNKGDLKTFCECYHPDIKVFNLISSKIGIEGKDKFTEIYRKLFTSSPDLKCNLKSRIVVDASVIDEEFVVGIPGYPSGLHTVAVYGFKDGLIDRVWFTR